VSTTHFVFSEFRFECDVNVSSFTCTFCFHFLDLRFIVIVVTNPVFSGTSLNNYYKLAKALHRAWAFHEYCSEVVVPALHFFEDWYNISKNYSNTYD